MLSVQVRDLTRQRCARQPNPQTAGPNRFCVAGRAPFRRKLQRFDRERTSERCMPAALAPMASSSSVPISATEYGMRISRFSAVTATTLETPARIARTPPSIPQTAIGTPGQQLPGLFILMRIVWSMPSAATCNLDDDFCTLRFSHALIRSAP